MNTPVGAVRALCFDIFDKIGFTEELYQFRGHTRIKQIKHLIETKQLDDDFFSDGPRPSSSAAPLRPPAGSASGP